MHRQFIATGAAQMMIKLFQRLRYEIGDSTFSSCADDVIAVSSGLTEVFRAFSFLLRKRLLRLL